jgi:pilus assembly protein Flp/PilA
MMQSASVRVLKALKRFAREEGGSTAIEYALIASGISIAIAATAYSLGSTLRDDYFGKVDAALK